MRSRDGRFLVVCGLLGLLVALLAGCSDRSDGESEEVVREVSLAGESAKPASALIDKLDGVDTSLLSGAEQKRWAGLVNELLSPCGDPVSVAVCVSEKRPCSRCLTAARYVRRLVLQGSDDSEVRSLYRARYGDAPGVTLESGDSPSKGTLMAPVTIVEFSDFECPHCRLAAPELRRAIEELDGKARLVFKNFPLAGHKHAVEAAQAALAAHAQGQFWPMHDLIFEAQRDLNRAKLEGFATQLGLDMERFRRDLDSEEIADAVKADKELGKRLGVDGTPAIFVNGRPFDEPVENLVLYVTEELE